MIVDRLATTRRAPSWLVMLVGLMVSAALIGVLYRRVDASAVLTLLGNAKPAWTTLSVGAIVPITLLLALRFQLACPKGSLTGFGEALRLTLVAAALNLVLPAKAGDLIKSFFAGRRGRLTSGTAFSIVAYERLCDVTGLLTWSLLAVATRPAGMTTLAPALLLSVGLACALGWTALTSTRWLAALLAGWDKLGLGTLPGWMRRFTNGWPALHAAMRGRKRFVIAVSLVASLAHLVQLWLFAVTVSGDVPLSAALVLFSLALLAGQIPFTIAGLGARDLAIMALLSRYTGPEAAAAIGLLSATRALLPALAAVPMLPAYVGTVTADALRWARGQT